MKANSVSPERAQEAKEAPASGDLKRIADALEYIAELERIRVRRDYMDMPTLAEWKKQN